MTPEENQVPPDQGDPSNEPSVLQAKASGSSQAGEVSERRRKWRVFARNRTALVGLVLMVGLVILAVFAPFFMPHDPLAQNTTMRLESPNSTHLLGLDNFGRDIFSRLILGARVSLIVGVAAVALGGSIGAALGIAAGYLGGRVEFFIMRFVDIVLSFPDLITGLLVLAVIGPGLRNLIIAIAVTIMPRFARMAHGPTLSLKNREFIESAVVVGGTDLRVMGRHIWPNVRGEILVLASLWTATAIRIEANLSFIGLGVAPPTPTWGQMIRDGMAYLGTSPWFSIAPGIAIFIAVLAFNLLGDGLRDVLDPRSQGRR